MKRKGKETSKTQRNKKTKKQKDDDDNNDGGESQNAASGAEFPDLVVHKILSLFTTRFGARFRTLSKQWDRMWSSLPVVEIKEGMCNQDQSADESQKKKTRTKFLKFVRKCLERSVEHKHTMEKLRLQVRCHGNHFWFNKSLSVAVEGNLLKELNLQFIILLGRHDAKCVPFRLEKTILESAKSLTVLKLEHVAIVSDDGRLDLPCLKTMSLKCVMFCTTGLALLPLLSGCPVIEHLSLSAVFFTSAGIHSQILSRIQVSSSSLRSLQLMGYGNNLDVSSCQKLTSLELYNNFHLDSSCNWFVDLDSKAPLLENLILHDCKVSGIEQLNIVSHHLKRFVFLGPFSRYLSTKFPNLLEAVIMLDNTHTHGFGDDYELTFLGNVYCSTKTVLQYPKPELLIIPEEKRIGHAPPFPRLKNLEVHIGTSTTAQQLSAVENSLRWMAPSTELILNVKENSSKVLSEFSGRARCVCMHDF